MSTNIQLLRSGIAYKRPAAAPLLDGQAAINYNDAEPGLFWRLSNGQLAKAGPVALTDNGMEPNAAPAGETGNSVGEEWLDSQPALYSPILHIFNGTEFVTANGFTVDKSTGDLTLLRTLEVTHLIAGSAQINGDLVVGGNITPNGQNCAFYLGLPNERWDYLYACNFNITYDGLIGRDLFVDRDVTVHRNLTVGNYVKSNLTPDLDATRFLGLEDHRWLAYLSHLDVDGNSFIGHQCSDTLTVEAFTTFKCEVEFLQPIQIDQIGKTCNDTLDIHATTTVYCPIEFKNEVILPPLYISDPLFNGLIQLGDGCGTSQINLNGAITQFCDMVPNADNQRHIGSGALRYHTLWSYAINASGTSTFGVINATTLTVSGGTTLNTCTAASLTVTGNTSLQNTTVTNLTASGNTSLQGTSATSLTVTGATNLNTLTVTGQSTLATTTIQNLTVSGNTTLGSACGNTLTVNSTTTFKCPVTFEDQVNIPGDITLGNGCATSTVNLNGAVTLSCDMMPNTHNTRSIGSGSNRLKALYATDVFTGDLHMKNERGDFTLVEETDYLTIRNNKTGKTYRLLMEEV